MAPILFTPELRADASAATPDHLDSLLVQWARDDDAAAARRRDQLETAAALVPEAQRRRVLGPILARADDEQIKATVGGLFLAKMLSDHGWSVEVEPALGAQTPDLHICKPGAEYLVEIRRVVGRAVEDARPRLLVTRALKHIRTASPLMIEVLRVDLAASLKPLVQHVEEVLSRPAVPVGRQRFSSPGVFVAYEVHPLGETAASWPAVFGWPIRMIHGNDADLVKKAINEKLRAYKVPIVVALDLADLGGASDGCDDVIEAFYGARKILVPIRLSAEDPHQEAWLGPMQDGMLAGRDRNGDRARERLLALLPFYWGFSGTRPEKGFGVHARVLANPARGSISMLEEFTPLPRFLVGPRTDAETVEMQWAPPSHPAKWWHIL